jgi:hypothetical protein
VLCVEYNLDGTPTQESFVEIYKCAYRAATAECLETLIRLERERIEAFKSQNWKLYESAIKERILTKERS